MAIEWSLSTAACLLGTVLVLLHLPALFAPESCRRLVAGFPRNKLAGSLLTGFALLCVGYIVYHAEMPRFDHLKVGLFVVIPVAYILIVKYLDELLAPRALGGLLLLAADPLLDIARWHPSPVRLVVTSVVYIGIVTGMLLVLSPYRFRKAYAFWVSDDTRCRLGGGLGVLLGGVLIVLGLTVY